MQDKIDIVVIRGAPGSGKSATAKSLSSFFPNGVRMEIDTIRSMVISVDWTNQQEHINMLHASTHLVIEFLNLGFGPIIVIDTFSGDKINRFLENLYKHDASFIIKIFGLYTTDEELKRRLDLRRDSEFREFTICKQLNDDVLNWRHEMECQINTTGLFPIQTAEMIHEVINGLQYIK